MTTPAEFLATFRAAALALPAAQLSKREVAVAYAIVTKLGNLATRRQNALKPAVTALFTGDAALTSGDRAVTHSELTTNEDEVVLRQTNGTYGLRTVSEAKAFALLATKKPSAKRMATEKPPRPAQPPPRFSAEKFRGLIEKGVLTQAEYDACLEAAAPRPTLTVDVPVWLEEAIADAALGVADAPAPTLAREESPTPVPEVRRRQA